MSDLFEVSMPSDLLGLKIAATILGVAFIAMTVQMVMGKWPWEILFPKPPTPEPSPIEQRLPYGNVGIRATHDRVAIVDYDTNTVLASTSWRIRPESVVQLTQTGRVYAVTVADDDNENTPRRTVLQYIRPALPGEELDEIQEGDHV